MHGIALGVGAVLLLIGGIPALIVGIILLVAAIGLAIYKHWDEIKAFLEPIGQWIYDHIISPVWNFIKGAWDLIVESVKSNIRVIERNFYGFNWNFDGSF